MTDTSVKTYMNELGKRARRASTDAADASTTQKNDVLAQLAKQLHHKREPLKKANQLDVIAATTLGKDPAFIDRLTLSDSVIDGMIEGVNQIIALPDLIGTVGTMQTMKSGMQLGKMRVPLGVIGIIYESRPNVTIDAAALCIKAGNATILRGGSEALHSNTALAQCITDALSFCQLNADIVQVVNTADRAAVSQLITSPQYVDVIIPRGGKSLIERINAEATIPVIKHLDGNCHVYVDQFADLAMAVRIAYNAKVQRLGTCSTMESLLVHEQLSQALLSQLAPQYAAAGIEMRVDAACGKILSALGIVWVAATPLDWQTEYLGPIVSIKAVANLDEAIDHINEFGSHHTDSIVTTNQDNLNRFLRRVDSASVMANASTRLADGFEYGLGAEIGISTDKLHARGPVGLEGLTTYKWIVLGHGELR
jgi:glutamate-5-semialdehyde dehydrogenase